MADLVKAEYQTFEVMFSEEGWFNATTAAEKFGKRVDHWLKTEETQSYIEALARHLNSPKRGDLVKAKRGITGVRPAVDGRHGLQADQDTGCLRGAARRTRRLRQRRAWQGHQARDRRRLRGRQSARRGLVGWEN